MKNNDELTLLEEELRDTLTIVNKSFAGYYPAMSDRSVKYLIKRIHFLKIALADIEFHDLMQTQKLINEN